MHMRIAALIILAAIPAYAQDGSSSEGKKLYAQTGCYECHGTVGQGAGISGPRIAPTGLSLDDFAAQLRRPAREMPPYSEKVMSDKQLNDIYTWLRTIGPPPAPGSIKLLQ